MYSIFFDKKAMKDFTLLKSCGLDGKSRDLIGILRLDPYLYSPSFEKLSGDLQDAFSRRINIHHRLVYQVLDESKTVKIISLWSHYEF